MRHRATRHGVDKAIEVFVAHCCFCFTGQVVGDRNFSGMSFRSHSPTIPRLHTSGKARVERGFSPVPLEFAFSAPSELARLSVVADQNPIANAVRPEKGSFWHGGGSGRNSTSDASRTSARVAWPCLAHPSSGRPGCALGLLTRIIFPPSKLGGEIGYWPIFPRPSLLTPRSVQPDSPRNDERA